MKVIRHAGTLFPLVFIILFILAVLSSQDGALTWERPVTSAAPVMCLYLGIHALVSMAHASFGSRPTLFLIVQIWHKIGLLATYIAILLAALTNTDQAPDFIPEWLIWALLVSTSGMLCMSNLILFFGRKREWLIRQTHALPLQSLIHDYRERRRVRDDG